MNTSRIIRQSESLIQRANECRYQRETCMTQGPQSKRQYGRDLRSRVKACGRMETAEKTAKEVDFSVCASEFTF